MGVFGKIIYSFMICLSIVGVVLLFGSIVFFLGESALLLIYHLLLDNTYHMHLRVTLVSFITGIIFFLLGIFITNSFKGKNPFI